MSKTIKVRIAVAVDSCGSWYAFNRAGFSSIEAQWIVQKKTGPDRNCYWITAELPIPTVDEIPGIVEKSS